MLKKLCLIGICAMAFSAQAALTTYGACAGGAGVIVKGLNGTRYCLSNIKMNWFSAFSWCEAAGGHLASASEACDNGTEKWRGEYCPNKTLFDMNPTGRAWTKDMKDPNYYSWAVRGWANGGDISYVTRLDNWYALCAGNY